MKLINSELYEMEISQIAADLQTMEGSILITGATGMIGSCILDVLLKANEKRNGNFQIYAVGRSQNRFNERFDCSENIKFMEQDICNELQVTERLDYIIHTASHADPLSYSLYPVETILTNIQGTRNILEYGKRHKSTRILFTSSFEAYGDNGADIYAENDYGLINPIDLRSGYPESKRTAELLCKSYKEEYGVNVIITRLSSVYGPTMKENDSKAHAQFLRSGAKREDIIMKSAGLQKRSYCYLMDAISAIFKVLFCGNVGEIYNIANCNSISTIAEFAHMVADLCGTAVIYQKPGELEKRGYSRPHNCILDTHKLERLGWKGRYGIYRGISNTLRIMGEQ